MARMTKQQYLEAIRNKLIGSLTERAKALPPGFNKDRFTMNCVSVIQDMLSDKDSAKRLAECSVDSIVIAFMKGALLDLDFFNGECYIIPYGGTANFQTNYRGEIKLCKKYSKNRIRDIYAKNVREGDFFEEKIEGGKQSVTWKPLPFNDEQIIGTFAVVLYEDGSMIYDTMSKAMIEKTRQDYSKMPNSPAWKKSPGEMYKKTVLRRLTKLVDFDFANADQLRAFDEGGDATFEPSGMIEKQSEEVVDVFAQDVQEQKQIPEKQVQQMPVFTQEKQKEAVPVSRAQGSGQDEYAAFEEQYSQRSLDDFTIPDEDPDGLPFR